MQVQVNFRGLKEFIAKNEKLIKELEKGKFSEVLAKKITNRAKYRAPRKSGKMIRSINYKLKGTNITITCTARNEKGVPYPEILEEGLSKFIPIGTARSPRIIVSGGGKTAFLPFIKWAVVKTLDEKEKLFRQTMLKRYK